MFDIITSILIYAAIITLIAYGAYRLYWFIKNKRKNKKEVD